MKLFGKLISVLSVAAIFAAIVPAVAFASGPVNITMGSSSVYDLRDWKFNIDYQTGTKIFNLPSSVATVGPNFDNLVVDFYNVSSGSVVGSVPLVKSDPRVRVVDNGDYVEFYYDVQRGLAAGLDLVPGNYELRVLDYNKDPAGFLRGSKTFSVIVPPLPQEIFLKQNLVQAGLYAEFSILDNLESGSILPLLFPYPGANTTHANRAYLTINNWDLLVKDPNGSNIAKLSTGGVLWDSNGSYRFKTTAGLSGIYKISFLKNNVILKTANLNVVTPEALDLSASYPALDSGDITFNFSNSDGSEFYLPYIEDQYNGEDSWESYSPEESYRFLIYDNSAPSSPPVVNWVLDSSNSYLIQSIGGTSVSVIVNARANNLRAGSYQAKISVDQEFASADVGIDNFTIIEDVPTSLSWGSAMPVEPGDSTSFSVRGIGGDKVNLARGYDVALLTNNQGVIGTQYIAINANYAGDYGDYTFDAPEAGSYKLTLYESLNGSAIDQIDLTVQAPVVVVGGGTSGGGAAGGGAGGTTGGGSGTAPLRCNDLASDFWAYDIINYLIDRDYYPMIVSSSGRTCRAGSPVTRAEFTEWLMISYGLDQDGALAAVDLNNIAYSDVNSGRADAAYIVLATNLGIINGYPNGTFKPDAGINRAEVLKILLRSSSLFEVTSQQLIDLDNFFPGTAPKTRFSDVSVSEWYYPYLHYGVAWNIIVGYQDGTARMENTVLYGEAAKILKLAKEIANPLN